MEVMDRDAFLKGLQMVQKTSWSLVRRFRSSPTSCSRRRARASDSPRRILEVGARVSVPAKVGAKDRSRCRRASSRRSSKELPAAAVALKVADNVTVSLRQGARPTG